MFQCRYQWENILKKKTAMWPGNHLHLGAHFFPSTTSLGFLGRCVPSSVSGAQEPNGSILQNIRKTFHGARKVRKYLSFSKNSRTSSPVLGSPDSSPQPCVFFFLSLKFSTAPTFTSSVRKSRTSSIVVTAQTSERTGSGNPFFCS